MRCGPPSVTQISTLLYCLLFPPSGLPHSSQWCYMEIPEVKGCLKIPMGHWIRHIPKWQDITCTPNDTYKLGQRTCCRKNAQLTEQNGCLRCGGVKSEYVMKTATRSHAFVYPHTHCPPQTSFLKGILFQHLRKTSIFFSAHSGISPISLEWQVPGKAL